MDIPYVCGKICDFFSKKKKHHISNIVLLLKRISESNFAWNSLQKEHHIANVAEKKYAKRGGVSEK